MALVSALEGSVGREFRVMDRGPKIRATVRPVEGQLILKLLVTVCGEPSKAGTRARLNVEETHPPTDVPPKGPSTTFAVVTRPLVAKVI